jgi:exonuclease III
MGMDIVVLTETKIVDERYTCFSQGYEIHASKAISTSQGGVALAIRKDRGQTWDVEDLTVEWGNIIGCTLVSGQWQKWLIGVYLPPSQFGGGTLDLLTTGGTATSGSPGHSGLFRSTRYGSCFLATG